MTTPEPVQPAPTGSVVLCGSLDPSRVASLSAAADWYRSNVNSGTVVHVPTRDPSVPPEEHARRWYRLIDVADRVVIVTDPSGYIGEQTAREKAYAEQQGCTVVVEAWQPAMRVQPAPAPDTEALQQQVRVAIAQSYGYDSWAEVVAVKDGEQAGISGAADAVLALPWIKYAAGQRHVVTMHERNNAAIAKTNREFAEENAGLRADLDQAHATPPSMVRDLLDALKLGPMPDRPLDTVWTTLLKIVSEQEDNRHATAMAGVRDRLEVKQLRAEVARVSGARPSPDDAAAVERFDAVFDVAIRLFRELSTGEHGYPGAPARRTRWIAESRIDTYHQVLSAAREWRTRRELADLGATPTTGPAPAAADLVREFHEAFGLPINDTTRTSNKLRAELIREEAREAAEAIEQGDALQWAKELADLAIVTYGAALTFGIDLDAAVRLVHDSNMSKLGDDGRPVMRADGKVLKGPRYRPPDMTTVVPPAAPQAPAEPTECKEQAVSVQSGTEIASPPAREDTAPPDDDCNDGLIVPGPLVPIQSEES